MTIVGPGRYRGPDDNRNSRNLSTRERVAGGVFVAVIIVAVVACFANPALILPVIGLAVLAAVVGGILRNNRGFRRYALLGVLLAGIGGAVAVLASPAAMPLLGGVIYGVISIFTGIGTGWHALWLLPEALAAVPFAEPLLLGAASGTLTVLLLRLIRSRLTEKAVDSLVSASLSGDPWSRSLLTVETFVVSVISSYLAIVLLEHLGVFAAHGADAFGTATAAWHVLGGGGGGDFSGGIPWLGILIMLVILFCLMLGFGCVTGIATGIPLGTFSGWLSWNRLMHGAAAAVARDFFIRMERREATRGRWIGAAVGRGCGEAMIGGILGGFLLLVLHIFGVL